MDNLRKCLLIMAAGAAMLGFSLITLTPAFGEDVFVTNDPTTPVPIQDVDNPARLAVQGQCDFTLPNGVGASNDVTRVYPCLVSVVPPGKRLVIEFVTARANLPQKQFPILLIHASGDMMGVGTLAANHQIALTVGPRNAGSRDDFAATHMVRIYAHPGTDLRIETTRAGSVSGEAFFVVTWTGYLVDIP
jgi:hypothetical protein